ncbi:Uncharacterized protein conserved in bacteria [Legionella steigerwaltii]|uniref:Uncharacterized protein conserved in bacteria n=1 Tax=Legionella steigerwaltii TaxID=460 RepID=A0A378LCN9_9GAMM|nr:poly(ADP-ribose) glycohydrolase domain-containing protein [Legionella steigerwaltii]KTD79552.1 hypothetical protein Lstg_0768 [Legionella steigerwaltii]STY24563.1 Uncharacterized protein conserved in bacteria [Legionella steigerwaltii]
MFLKTLFRVHKANSPIKEVYAAHKPNLITGSISGNKWRHKSMGKTLNYITDPNKLMQLQKQAQLNLSQWAQKRIPPPKSVEVVPKDWGVATLEATKKHGVTYSVLNMANSVFPGGAALEGGSAQEENMWMRSTCPLSLLDKMIYLDKDTMTFRYHDTASKLLDAKIKMTDEEREVLKKHREELDAIVYKVLFNQELRVCFRGPEVVLVTSGFDDFGANRNIPDSDRSYSFLHPSDIFPFYEFRSAAPDLNAEPHALDSESLKQYTADLRRRIAAQLDTLILEGKAHVILGAWGCGAFKNDPSIVAEIYGEEIEKRARFFEHIMFPILNTSSYDNYAIFDKCLTGMKLGDQYSTTPTLTLE